MPDCAAGMLCQVDPSVGFDQVGGLDHYIAALKEMVFLPLVYPELFERFHISPPRGVLFYGPPGETPMGWPPRINLPPWACHPARSAAAASPHSIQRCAFFGGCAQRLLVWCSERQSRKDWWRLRREGEDSSGVGAGGQRKWGAVRARV